ncbi:hypothetical protein IVB18_21585 [Bradyrhizobium sp. 186]|uniref:hypothetical protein n=1 Tax=Bradyrhizobium sp. 186 TaxID=2782654 RepID=UPI002000EBE3|nr:hypothetical protein [Bradyrhizobium sp. 186]UPK39582.1 hypothetical protein IVB18_21585 [Bradyrhizobium sp. 186]
MIYLKIFPEPLMLIVVVDESSRKLYARVTSGATLSSQNAAALLIDLGTVDIRRVGTHCSGYSKWGVPSKNNWPSGAQRAQR